MECAVKNGLSPDPDHIQKSIRSLFDAVEKTEAADAMEAGRLCPVCATSFASIKKTGNRLSLHILNPLALSLRYTYREY